LSVPEDLVVRLTLLEATEAIHHSTVKSQSEAVLDAIFSEIPEATAEVAVVRI
jgi:hypothetical protein